ncbi:MAG: ribosome silencing factor [Chloroflexi bacterium]|nr:ribosome silencing factor [Chloroflexota bacterium]
MKAEEIAHLAVEVAAKNQANGIVMLDVERICSFADYFVICNGDSQRQMEAIWRGITDELKQSGVRSHHSEGSSISGWLLADFGSVIVHVFAPAERDYYQLDRLWEEATPVVRIQ